tara:strand:+ start:3452 stop:4318 length:867 start_codon:yes stop_codon:yes gene_type:complete
MEVLTLNIPTNYKKNSAYFNESKSEIELIALGSSQMDGAINPEFLDKSSICLASSSQHHKLDFTILKQLSTSTKKLKYVVLELSNSHLELPHNSKDFWKNAVYLKFFNVNAFDRKTYFKDELIYIANPDLYTRMITDYYIRDNYDIELNKFGFNTNSFDGSFPLNDFNEDIISKLTTTPNQKRNTEIFKNNTAYLFSMIEYMEAHNLQTIICTLPLYKTYTANLNSTIVKRRDSVISVIKNRYPNVIFMETEKDPNFKITDFNNANHLNPDGSKKFTLLLNAIVNKLD